MNVGGHAGFVARGQARGLGRVGTELRYALATGTGPQRRRRQAGTATTAA